MRKLASIQRIHTLVNHANADRLEVASILGWQCVVEKGKFNENDLVVWFEIDSWVPTKIAPFLTKLGKEPREYEGVKGERLRTVRLRGALSQGLVISLSNIQGFDFVAEEGKDLTDLLGILKYEPPVPAQLAGQVKGMFPSFIKKTDQERIQNLPEWFEQYKDVLWETSVKLDGSSMTVYHNNGETGVCSRNLDLKDEGSNTLWTITKHYGITEALVKLALNIALQGEVIGEGIQGNHERLKGQDFYVFDIWNIDKGRHATPLERHEILKKLRDYGCDLKEVPILHEALPVFQTYDTIDKLLQFAGSGPSLNNEIREGVVFKAAQPINGEVLSFKAINNTYLLKEK